MGETHRRMNLPDSVNSFIQNRLDEGGVSAVLLYGSYARGTQHKMSDVDLIFLVDEGFKSECIDYRGLCFEILETTSSNTREFWKRNFDEDRHWYLWKDVKVLFDRQGEGAEFVADAQSLVGDRSPWTAGRIANHRQAVLAKVDRIEFLAQQDSGTAAILIVELVRELVENWFRIRGRFVPSSKEFLSVLDEESPDLANQLRSFHLSPGVLKDRFAQVRDILDAVYLS